MEKVLAVQKNSMTGESNAGRPRPLSGDELAKMPVEQMPSIHKTLEAFPGFKRINELLGQAAREAKGKEPVSLPAYFQTDAAYYVAWYVLNNVEMSPSSLQKIPQAKSVYEYCRGHPELGVSADFCQKILEGLDGWTQ